MELPIADFGGGNEAVIEAPESIFSRKYNSALVHQAVTVCMSNARLGTRAQKTRAEVRHTTRKLFRQKGSGRARAGHSSSPIRRGGGRAFPAKPHDNFQRKLTRQMFRAAMAVILSRQVRDNKLAVVRSFALPSHKTRELAALLSADSSAKILLVDSEWDDKNITLASRNLNHIRLVSFSGLLPVNLIDADKVIFSERALRRCAEAWA